jgi:hypothetical protein
MDSDTCRKGEWFSRHYLLVSPTKVFFPIVYEHRLFYQSVLAAGATENLPMPTWLDWPILALTFVGMLVVLGMLLKTAREAQRDDRSARRPEMKAGAGGSTRRTPRNETSGESVLKPDHHDQS